MVKKDILIQQFSGYHDLEESIIEKISEFMKTLHCEETDLDRSQLFDSTLETLKNDSQKHRQMIQEMVEYIKQSPKNEL